MLKKRMSTSWRWGGPVVVFENSVSLSVVNFSHVWTAPCGLCSGWICGTPATWSSGTSSWAVCVFPSGSWVRLGSTTHGERNTLGLLCLFPPNTEVLCCTPAGAGWVWFHYRCPLIYPLSMCCHSNSRAIATNINTDNRLSLKFLFNQGRFRWAWMLFPTFTDPTEPVFVFCVRLHFFRKTKHCMNDGSTALEIWTKR